MSGRVGAWLTVYVGRMKGTTRVVKRPPLKVVLRTWAAAFAGIFLVTVPTLYLDVPASAKLFLIGSFGATAVLLYAAPRSDLAQPRSLVGGHLLSAFVGVSAYKLFDQHLELAAALAVATSVAVMQLTLTLHPPGGATALIAVLGPDKVHDLGYRYLLTPVLVGVLIMLVVALIANNLSSAEHHHYPVTWR